MSKDHWNRVRMKQIKTKNNTISYSVEGRGLPIVLIHGFCEDRLMWEDFKQDLLEEKYKVITMDLPGFGRSSIQSDTSIDDYADAVLEVLAAAKVDECILIGHSMGGYTAMAIAEKRPEILKGMVLFHSHPYADSDEKKQARLRQIDFIHKYGHPLYVKQLIPKLFPKRYGLSHPFDLDKLIHRAARYSEKGITNALTAMADRPDRSKVLENIACPVCFIVGDKDEAVPADKSYRQLALPNIADVHILKGVGHMGMFEQKRNTQLIVRKFVAFCERD